MGDETIAGSNPRRGDTGDGTFEAFTWRTIYDIDKRPDEFSTGGLWWGQGPEYGGEVRESAGGDFELRVFYLARPPRTVEGMPHPYRDYALFARCPTLEDAMRAAEVFAHTHRGQPDPTQEQQIAVMRITPDMARGILDRDREAGGGRDR